MPRPRRHAPEKGDDPLSRHVTAEIIKKLRMISRELRMLKAAIEAAEQSDVIRRVIGGKRRKA